MQFSDEVAARIASYGSDEEFGAATAEFLKKSIERKYSYNFSWLGRPIIQYPQDMVAMQELIWRVKPDLIIETGIAHGGSLIFSASMLAQLDMVDAIEKGVSINPSESKRAVLGIDIDIRKHNREAIEAHPMYTRIQMIEGSSIDPDIIAKVRTIASDYKRIMVCLDSNHTHHHALAELEAYASLVTKESYCVVFDTVIEDLPEYMFPDRNWGPGDNPKTAVYEYLKKDGSFVIDAEIENKLQITVAPDGFLKKIS